MRYNFRARNENEQKLLTSLLLLASPSAFATDTIKWDFLSTAYQNADRGEFDYEGFELSGSKLINKVFFIEGQYSSISNHESVVSPLGQVDLDIDLTQLSLGFGYRHALTSNTDIFTVLSYEKIEDEYSFSDHYDNRTNGSNGYS
ncbi:MAG: outer membrane beta-barrel protein [Thalassotalea sp.]